jgi:hypothetical protein
MCSEKASENQKYLRAGLSSLNQKVVTHDLSGNNLSIGGLIQPLIMSRNA